MIILSMKTREGVNEESLVQHAEERKLLIPVKSGVQEALKALHEKPLSYLISSKDWGRCQVPSRSYMPFGLNVVKLFLQLVKAEGTGNWDLRLQSVAVMLPRFVDTNWRN